MVLEVQWSYCNTTKRGTAVESAPNVTYSGSVSFSSFAKNSSLMM